MDLSRMTIVARPRRPWESIDLGFALGRAWFGRLWLCWWLAAGPVAFVSLPALHQRPDLWLLLLWWCKPAFEAVALYWLSRAVFGEQPGAAATARSLPRALPPRLWPQLLWRRIGMGRSFSMPVTLLEAPRGGARRQRLRVLGTGAAGWLTLVCVHLEAILWLSGVLLLAFLVPEGLPTPDFDAVIMATGSAPYWAANLLMVLAMSVMAPFYVAAGFALYLGRRTELEAWDLELAFRRRHAAPRASRARVIAAAVLLTALLLPGTAATAAAMTPEQAKARIETILAQPDFGGTREERVWVYVGDDSASAADDDGGTALPAWLIKGLATAVKWTLVIAAVWALLVLTLHLRREFGRPRQGRQRRPTSTGPQAPVAQEAGPTEPLPSDVQAAVHGRLATGDVRGALGLLYRAQVAQLRAAGLALADSATEAECLRAARTGAEPQALIRLARVVRLWQAVAYGHQAVDTDSVAVLAQAGDQTSAMDGHG
jgi:hypothetical protein